MMGLFIGFFILVLVSIVIGLHLKRVTLPHRRFERTFGVKFNSDFEVLKRSIVVYLENKDKEILEIEDEVGKVKKELGETNSVPLIQQIGNKINQFNKESNLARAKIRRAKNLVVAVIINGKGLIEVVEDELKEKAQNRLNHI